MRSANSIAGLSTLRRLAIAGLVALLALACKNPSSSLISRMGTVSISSVKHGIPASASSKILKTAIKTKGATAFPASVDLSALAYTASFTCLSSPLSGASYASQTSGDGSFACVDIPVGSWTVTISAATTSGSVDVAAGSANFSVTSGGSSTVTVNLYPPSGTGSFAIADWSWPSGAGNPKAVLTPLYLSSGPGSGADAVTLSLTAGGGGLSATYSTSSLAAGSYLLTLNLYSTVAAGGNGAVSWGDFYSVLVLPGCSTTVSVSATTLAVNVAPAKPTLDASWVASGSSYEGALSWAGAGADSFDIYRSDNGGSSYTELTSVSGSTLSFDDSGADYTASAGYYYKIVALNAYTSGVASDPCDLAKYSGSATATITDALSDVVVTISGGTSLSSSSTYAASCAIGSTAYSPSSYAWYLDGTAISGATSSSLSGATIIATGIALGSSHTLVCEVSDGVWSWDGSLALSYAAAAGNLKWSFKTDGNITSSPAIASDGTIYVGSSDDSIYAIDPAGTKKWSFATGGWVESVPAVGPDGTVYVGSYDESLYAIDPSNGSKKWSFPTGGTVNSCAAIAMDGTIYIGSNDDSLYAINPGGTQKWSYATGSGINASPVIATDGTIYVGSLDGKLYAINPDGTLKWSYATGDSINSSPAIASDGTIYVGSRDCSLYAINPDGTQKWSYATEGSIDSSPAIGSDGTIYVGSNDQSLYAITAAGTKKWSFGASNMIRSSPAIGSDGTIYVGSYDQSLYAITAAGTKKWSFPTGNTIYSSPAIAADGTIYVGSQDDYLYAIYGGAGPASGPWPMFHKNVHHTGNAKD